jgi:hypothetical protein
MEARRGWHWPGLRSRPWGSRRDSARGTAADVSRRDGSLVKLLERYSAQDKAEVAGHSFASRSPRARCSGSRRDGALVKATKGSRREGSSVDPWRADCAHGKTRPLRSRGVVKARNRMGSPRLRGGAQGKGARKAKAKGEEGEATKP